MLGVREIIAGVLALLLFAGGYYVGRAVWQNELSTYKTSVAIEATERANKNVALIDGMKKANEALAVRIALADAAANEEQRKDDAEIERLRRGLNDGTLGLRIGSEAIAGTRDYTIPEAPKTSGVDNGPSGGFGAALGSDYIALRTGIARQRNQLKACQAYIRELQ